MPDRFDNYDQAIEYLYSRINYERAVPQGYSEGTFRLDRMRQLLQRLGDPQASIPVVHIAGSKGKGSTAAMTAAMLQASGRQVGLFTSPHITTFEERMMVNGRRPSQSEMTALVNRVAEVVEEMERQPAGLPPTYFEILTAIAWLYFVERRVDSVALEVGLGGRLDATNVCNPDLCVITEISRDHTHLLGDTLAQIAGEKAGIIKPGVPVISGARAPEAASVIEARARELGSPCWRLGSEIHYEYRRQIGGPVVSAETGRVDHTPAYADITTPLGEWRQVPLRLLGEHQARNAALAVACIDWLRERGHQIDADCVRTGMSSLVWPARIEILRDEPTVIVDTAHNESSLRALFETLESFYAAKRKILVLAISRDKDVHGLLELAVPRCERLIVTRYLNNPRAIAEEELGNIARELGHPAVDVVSTPTEAWQLAEEAAQPDDLICVTGSFFIAAEVRPLVTANARPLPQTIECSASPLAAPGN